MVACLWYWLCFNHRRTDELLPRPVPIISRPTPVPLTTQIVAPKPRVTEPPVPSNNAAPAIANNPAAPPTAPWRRARAVPTPVPRQFYEEAQLPPADDVVDYANLVFTSKRNRNVLFFCSVVSYCSVHVLLFVCYFVSFPVQCCIVCSRSISHDRSYNRFVASSFMSLTVCSCDEAPLPHRPSCTYAPIFTLYEQSPRSVTADAAVFVAICVSLS